MGPKDTNYYWQLVGASPTDPAGTAQYGASEFGELRTAGSTAAQMKWSLPLVCGGKRLSGCHSLLTIVSPAAIAQVFAQATTPLVIQTYR